VKNPIKNNKPFKKGDKRINREGRPPVLPELKEVIAKILSQEKDGKTALERVITAIYNRALKGDTVAARELLDRYFGKVSQPLEHEGEIKIIREIIK